jgi:hypothetical protein
MYEQLWPIMKSLTRRALTRHVFYGSHDRSEIKVDIPAEWVELVQKELDEELAALN